MIFTDALWWAFLNLLSIVTLAFFSMQEMACVSFNKIRLHYYVSKGITRAVWLNYLLQNPARLFGTTLFCVNVAMFIGSECARQTYSALSIDPDFAPITQVILVVIFAELAPMFAARRYPEHLALLGAPFLYFSARLLAPVLWTIEVISKIANRIVGGSEGQAHAMLNQEDLQRILDQDDEGQRSEGQDVNAVARNIFSLRNKEARDVMQPINTVASLPSNATIKQLKLLLNNPSVNYIPIYHRSITHIVGIIQPRNLTQLADTRYIKDYATPPWFITQHAKAIQILKEFKLNNRNMAVVLDEQGLAIGIITLDDLTEELFGKVEDIGHRGKQQHPLFIIDRTFSGDTTVEEFNKEFGVQISPEEHLTLAELLEHTLGHQPEVGESVYIPPFELEVKEATLMEIKKITITTRL